MNCSPQRGTNRKLVAKAFLLLGSALITVSSAHAQQKWIPAKLPNSASPSEINIRIGYTLGTHKLKSTLMIGELSSQDDKIENLKGQISVPIDSIKEGNEELECHLRSSLGLDYSKSDFPQRHVCDRDDRLPESGPNSIAFPEIALTVDRLEKSSDEHYTVHGSWTIHGVSRPVENLKLKIKVLGNEATADGETSFKLPDFGIIVKRAFVISASETAHVKLSLKFQKVDSGVHGR